MKNYLISLGLLLILSSCGKEQEYITYDGFTQGTTFHIVYKATPDEVTKEKIDSIFLEINKTFSLYDSTSILSKINNNETDQVNDLFIKMYNESKNVYEKTEGAFDITVGQVVNAWGFGNSDTLNVNSNVIDSLMNFVGFDKITLEGYTLTKENKNVKLDFNAIAQGFTSDVIAEYFESVGLENYLIEVGGEVRAKGKSSKLEFWKVGIDKPTDNSGFYTRQLHKIILLNNKSLATSGNYRKFYIKNGERISHEINPKTGYPSKQSLLSVTVLANTCSEADAYATSFMVLGLEKSLEILNKNPELEAYFISSGEDQQLVINQTKGFDNIIYKKN